MSTPILEIFGLFLWSAIDRTRRSHSHHCLFEDMFYPNELSCNESHAFLNKICTVFSSFEIPEWWVLRPIPATACIIKPFDIFKICSFAQPRPASQWSCHRNSSDFLHTWSSQRKLFLISASCGTRSSSGEGILLYETRTNSEEIWKWREGNLANLVIKCLW